MCIRDSRYTEGECANGCFMQPTLITNVTNDMRVAQEEIFGPVAVVIKFKTEVEVIAMANDSTYGLGGAVWTRDINRAIRVAQSIDVYKRQFQIYAYHYNLLNLEVKTNELSCHCGLWPVSYTHLDVYKRQCIAWAAPLPAVRPLRRPAWCTVWIPTLCWKS